jgi:hypothetical protein
MDVFCPEEQIGTEQAKLENVRGVKANMEMLLVPS